MDTLFSCYKNKFDDKGLEWALDMKDLVLQYSIYQQTMNHFRNVLPGRVVDIQYESLVQNPEKVMKGVVEKLLKLQWEPAILTFHTQSRVVQTNSMTQVRKEIYSSSVGAWRKYETQLEPMKKELEYQLAMAY